MSKIHDINIYNPSPFDVFFFDNNIWMYLYCPIANYEKDKQRKYAAFLNQVRQKRSCIWVNSLVLSEFCNAWLRLEFNNWKKRPENLRSCDYKKNFVQSESYNEIIQDIRLTLPLILKIAERGSDNFNAINLDAVYSELDNCDFNDSYYLELAYMNNWKIVTDDADFFKNNKLNVDIITANIK